MSSATSYCRRHGGLTWAALGPGMAAGAVSTACGVGLLASSGWLIVRAAQRPPVLGLCVAIGLVQAFALGRSFARYVQRVAAHRTVLAVLGQLRLDLFDTVVPLVPGALGRNGAGDVLTGFVDDTELVTEGLAKAMSAAVDAVAGAALAALVAGVVRPELAGAVAAGGLLAAAGPLIVDRRGRRREGAAAAERAALAGEVAETVRCAVELVAFGRRDLVEERLRRARRRSARLDAEAAMAAGAARAWASAMVGATVLVVAAIGLLGVGARPLGALPLAVVVFAALAGLEPVSHLPAALAAASRARAAAERLEALAAVPPAVTEPVLGNALPGGLSPGHAQLDRVSVRGQAGGLLLDDASLRLRPGERVALVGANGSGKTTAVHTLLHFVACASGHASLGGADVSGLTRETIAELCGWLPDSTHLFSASLAANLRLAKAGAGEDELWGALARAGLGPWARSLPDGLATVLGDGGRPLSAGERQRVGLARALLAGSPVLLLDEPTAHLDPATAECALRELLDAAGERSVLVVSHDPEVPGRVDRVMTLEKGAVKSVIVP